MSEEITNDMSQHAVSLYAQNDGVEEFPVLKAFQQYIDAEQEKARKRIIGLGVFFAAILIVVVAVFLFMLHGVNVRNQTLSDRLVEYAMKESERRAANPPAQVPVVQQNTSENSEALKAVTATLSALQQTIQKNNEEKAKQVQAPVHQEDPEVLRAKALLAKEKKQLAEERERLRQIEIDRQRRKLYPELYEDEKPLRAQTRTSKTNTQRNQVRTLTDEDIREILREAYPEKNSEVSPTEDKKKTEEKKDAEASDDADDAIEYFKDDDYTIPVDVKGSNSKVTFTVPTSD